MRHLLLFLFSIQVLGCSTLQGFLFPNKSDKSTEFAWEKDLRMQVNDKVYFGTAVVKDAEQYQILIFPPYKEISRLQWRTCHRGGAVKDAVKNSRWSFKDLFRKKEKIKYFPLPFSPRDIERERACSLKFEALDKSQKAMAFGMIAFPDLRPWFNVPATVECNGKVDVYFDGTSLCQAPAGAITRVSFSGEIYMDPRENAKCPPFKEIKEGVFEFKMPVDECIYNFRKPQEHESGNLRAHKFITFGYQKTPPQEDY